MSQGAGGLSDVLREMAAREASGDRKKRRRLPEPAKAESPQPAADSRRAAAGQPRPSRQATAAPARLRPVRTAPPKPDPLHVAAVPVFLVLAALLLVPGTWAVLILAGASAWRSDWPGAQSMALAMLACFPIAAFLVGGAWYFRRTTSRKPLRVP